MNSKDVAGKIDEDVPATNDIEFDAILDMTENDDNIRSKQDTLKPYVSIGGLDNLSEQDRKKIQTEIEKIILESVEKNRQLQIEALKNLEQKVGEVQDSEGQHKEDTALANTEISLKGLGLQPKIEETLLLQLTSYMKNIVPEDQRNAAKGIQKKEDATR